MFGPLFDVQMSFCMAGTRDSARLACPKNDGKRGTLAEDLQRWISRGRRSARDTFIRDIRRSGADFRGEHCILEHHIFRFAKMILRDSCSTSYDLASLLRGRGSTLHRWNGKKTNALLRGRQLRTELSIFEGSLAELLRFWCCQHRKLNKASPHCFVFDVATFESWGSLAELLRFQSCRKTE